MKKGTRTQNLSRYIYSRFFLFIPTALLLVFLATTLQPVTNQHLLLRQQRQQETEPPTNQRQLHTTGTSTSRLRRNLQLPIKSSSSSNCHDHFETKSIDCFQQGRGKEFLKLCLDTNNVSIRQERNQDSIQTMEIKLIKYII